MNYEDEIYHSGYLDGYYASMELYHSDDSEMTEEEKAKARRKRRRRNIALGTGAVAGGLGAALIYAKAKEDKYNREWDEAFRAAKEKAKNNLNKSAPKPKRTISGFRRNAGSYKVPSTRTYVPTWALERARKHPNTKYWTTSRDSKIKPNKTIPGFRRNPGTYRFDPNKDFNGFLTLQQMHRKARLRNYKN